MKIAKAMLLGCATLFGIGISPAVAADPPLFAAFKQFCADTQAKPDAVKVSRNRPVRRR